MEKDFLTSLVAVLPIGVFVIDEQGRLTAVNQKALDLLAKKISPAAAVGSDTLEFIKDIPELHEPLAVKLNNLSQFLISSLELKTDGKTTFLKISGEPIKGGLLIMFEDITKVKEAEEEEAEFVSVASHQLRTPLTGIQWVIERVLKTQNLSLEAVEYLNDVRMSIGRLNTLVDILLNVSRLEAGKMTIIPQPLELTSFIKDYFSECMPLCAKKNIILTFKQYPERLEILIDPNALRNIVQSLVSNAVEYTGEGGTIELSLQEKPQTFIFKVRDTGIGIPKEEQPHIFEKFKRAANAKLIKTDGTGLGLYIARQAVELLGGKIWFESELGRGSTFYAELPLKSEVKTGEKTFA